MRCVICDIVSVYKYGSVNKWRQSADKSLRLEKGWSVLRMMREFPSRKWKRSTLCDLIKRVDETGETDRKIGSGWPRSAWTPANIQTVDHLICSQEDRSGSHKSPREISRETGISRSSVCRIAKHFDDARCNCSPTPTFAKDLLSANNWKKTFNKTEIGSNLVFRRKGV